MTRREQITALLPDLVFVQDARKKAKMPLEEAVGRLADAIDWSLVDDAGNNLMAVLTHLRAATKRAVA